VYCAEHSPFFLLSLLIISQYTLPNHIEMAGSNTQISWSSTMAETQTTSHWMKLFKEKDNREGEKEIPSAGCKDEYTKTLCWLSKSYSQQMVRLHPVAWLSYIFGI